MANVKQTGVYRNLKQVPFLRKMVHRNRAFWYEVAWTAKAVKSGTFLAYFKTRAAAGKTMEQGILRYGLDLPALADHGALEQWLAGRGLVFKTGAFSIYLPPQAGLADVFGEVLAKYPPDAGLKILKDLKAPAEAKYVDREISIVTRVNDLTSNSPVDLLRVANYLHFNEVGPRVYDLVQLGTPHNEMSAYVVQDIAGEAPNDAECAAFIERLKELFKGHLQSYPNWKDMADFHCPDCKGNLLKDSRSGRLVYIDFQSFIMKDNLKYINEIARNMADDVHFGDKHWIRGGKYLYQSIPGLQHGQRKVDDRWNVFDKLLADAGADLKGNVIYDIGCNMGMMIHTALAKGARWAIGWDRPYVIPHSRKLLLAMGMTRFDLNIKNIDPDSEFAPDVPAHAVSDKGSVLFFLAMRKHIGFPAGVNGLPFEFILYEGHENETLDDTRGYLAEIQEKWRLDLCGITTYRDGDSRDRSAAVLRRRP